MEQSEDCCRPADFSTEPAVRFSRWRQGLAAPRRCRLHISQLVADRFGGASRRESDLHTTTSRQSRNVEKAMAGGCASTPSTDRQGCWAPVDWDWWHGMVPDNSTEREEGETMQRICAA